MENQMDLVKTAFRYVNSFKRHRALEVIKREEQQWDKANYHRMKAYEMFDKLELTLRAIQKGVRELDDETAEDEE